MTGSSAPGSRRVLGAPAAIAIVATAFLAGMLVERLRLDAGREEMRRRDDRVLQQYPDQRMRSERTIPR